MKDARVLAFAGTLSAVATMFGGALMPSHPQVGSVLLSLGGIIMLSGNIWVLSGL